MSSVTGCTAPPTNPLLFRGVAVAALVELPFVALIWWWLA